MLNQKETGMNTSDRLQITVLSSTADDPFAGKDSQYARDIKQFLTTIGSQGGELVRPRLALDSVQIQTVVVVAQVLGPIVGPAIAAAVTTWLQGRAGRKVREGRKHRNRSRHAGRLRSAIGAGTRAQGCPSHAGSYER
jgi:hypothetical protein